VVIKIISKKSSSDPIAVKEFELEKRILESLSHSNIVNIIGSGEFPRQFLVLEYLENGTLEQLLRHRRLELNEVIAWAIDLANAIDFMHSSIPGITIIHRDLKPANIGFSNNVIKLLDFGLSACVKQRSSINESYAMTGCTGSLRYMAPEVWLCRPYNETVDVYSLGVILWQMMTGATPFNDIKTKQAFHNTVVAGGSRPFVSPFWHSGIAELLRMCWHANSVLRPSSKSASALLRGIALSACACL
jgi:serine/threonine protein kinase